MNEARYTDPAGQVQIVQLPGTVLRPGHVHYRDAEHKGSLTCRHCDIPVHFNAGCDSIAGSSFAGRAAHFKRNNRQQAHEAGCLWPLRIDADAGDSREIDDTAGYRLHLNTLKVSPAFNRAGLYYKDENGRVKTADESLKRRETYAIKSVEDLKTFIIKADFSRIADSCVIFRNQSIGWADFFIRYGKNKHRHIDLFERLQANPSALHYCAMEVRLAKPVYDRPGGGRQACAQSRALFYQRDERGRPHFIMPRVFLDNRDDMYVRTAFERAGDYLVLGVPRLKSVWDANVVKHFINISITDRNQVAPVSIRGLYADARKKAERGSGPAPA